MYMKKEEKKTCMSLLISAEVTGRRENREMGPLQSGMDEDKDTSPGPACLQCNFCKHVNILYTKKKINKDREGP